MEIVAFKAEHILAMDIHPAQRGAVMTAPEYLAMVEALPSSFSMLHEGETLACFGWVEFHPGRVQIWSALSAKSGPHMVRFTRVAKRMVDALPHRRIEAEVLAHFAEGCRWMHMLGLTCETKDRPLRAYAPDGSDMHIFAKVN